MHCPNCTILKNELSFRMPQQLKNTISKQFIHHASSYIWEENTLHTSEAASNDLVDFLREMNLDSQVSFKPPHQGWMTIEYYDDYRNTSWLDTLIKSKNIRMYFQPIITQTGTIYGRVFTCLVQNILIF